MNGLKHPFAAVAARRSRDLLRRSAPTLEQMRAGPDCRGLCGRHCDAGRSKRRVSQPGEHTPRNRVTSEMRGPIKAQGGGAGTCDAGKTYKEAQLAADACGVFVLTLAGKETCTDAHTHPHTPRVPAWTMVRLWDACAGSGEESWSGFGFPGILGAACASPTCASPTCVYKAKLCLR